MHHHLILNKYYQQYASKSLKQQQQLIVKDNIMLDGMYVNINMASKLIGGNFNINYNNIDYLKLFNYLTLIVLIILEP